MGEYFDTWEVEHPQWFVMRDGKASFPYQKQFIEAIRTETGEDVLTFARYDPAMAKTIAVAPKLLAISYVLLALDSGGVSDESGEMRKKAYGVLRDIVQDAQVETSDLLKLPDTE